MYIQHQHLNCMCGTVFTPAQTNTDEELRESVLELQKMKKKPSQPCSQTLMSSYFRIVGQKFRNFINKAAGCERINTLYEVCIIIENYAELRNLIIEGNKEL